MSSFTRKEWALATGILFTLAAAAPIASSVAQPKQTPPDF